MLIPSSIINFFPIHSKGGGVSFILILPEKNYTNKSKIRKINKMHIKHVTIISTPRNGRNRGQLTFVHLRILRETSGPQPFASFRRLDFCKKKITGWTT